ncbi:MAG: acyltransferase family protein [Herbiconiux sp.]|nr:acyltransferase family protein [Herbiconiux sp.]
MSRALALLRTDRLQWMDALRGAAILLVILWHAPSLPALLGFDVPDYMVRLNNFFLPYRMPTLMLLSGLLLPRSLAKGLGRYALGKVQFIVWPYLIWAAVHIVQFGTAFPIDDPRAWIATGYLWFIFFIALYYAVAPLLVKAPAWAPPLAFWVLAELTPAGELHNFFFYGGFFFLGNLVARFPHLLDAVTRNRWVVFGLAAVAVVFGLVSMEYDVNLQPLLVPFSLAGIVAAIYFVQKTDDSPLLRPLRFVGRSSIVFYVAHFAIMIVALQVFETIVGPTVLAVLLLVSALAGCTALAWSRRWVPVRWLFEAPLLGALRRRIGRTRA